MRELTEKEICDKLWQWNKEGAKCRQKGNVNPYPANTVAYFMHCSGWLTEDLRLALIKADPKYAARQKGR